MQVDSRLTDTGPRGPADRGAQGIEEAARCLAREQYAESLRLAARALGRARHGAGEADLRGPGRDAARILAWSLFQLRRYGGCRRWLDHAAKTGLLPVEDPESDVIAVWLLLAKGAHVEALDRADRALAALRGQASCVAADYLLLRGRALTLLGRLDEAGESLEISAALFRLAESPGKLARVCNALGILNQQQCRYAAAREWLGRCISISQGLGLNGRLAQARLNAAVLGYKTGDYATARRECESAVADYTRIGNPTGACRAHLALGIIERLSGQYPAARRHLMEAHTTARRLRMKREQCLVLEFLGDVFRDEGRPTEARRYYARGLAIARDIAPEGDLMVELLRREGECLALQGKPEEGLAVLDEALAAALRLGDRFEEGVILRCRAAALAAMGDRAAALAQIEAAIARLQAIEAKHELAIAHLLAAELLSAQPEDQQRERSRGATA